RHFFLFASSRPHRSLHSFPTRRSSDLLWFRFESHFAWAATLTIALDLTKTIGFFALASVEFNLTAVAALLALMGYSVNDKVVVFDRIRENIRKTDRKSVV